MQAQNVPLFRQECLDAKRGEWLGVIELAMPTSYWALAALSFAVCLFFFGLLVFGQYTRHELVSGQLVPSLGLLTSTTPSPGVVTRVLVQEGETVDQGQALVEISTDLDSVSGGMTHASVVRGLEGQRARLMNSIHDQERLTAQKVDAIKREISGFRRQLTQLNHQVALQGEEADVATRLWQRFQSVKYGAISRLQIEQQKSVALGAQAQVAALKREQADIEQHLVAQQDQLRQLPLIASSDRVALQQKLADLDQSIAQNQSQSALVLRAAKAGFISNIFVKSGETAASGQRLLSLVPRGALLQAEFWLPNRAIGFISPGDRVVLHYRAYPYQEFGQYYGKVVDVARSASMTIEASTFNRKKPDESAYHVVVGLDRQTILVYGKSENLKPGLVVDAEILLDRRRLIKWVFEPLFEVGRSMTTGG